MANKVGKHIRNICETLEEHGPMGSRHLCDYLTGIEASNMGKYCSRGVGLGLLTVERGLRTRSNYSVFTVVPGWQEMADQRKTTKLPPPKPRKESPVNTRWSGISSIFNIGAF